MKNTKTIIVILFTVIIITFIWNCSSSVVKNANTASEAGSNPGFGNFPVNVLNSCTVDQALFNSWFASGQATENGAVKHVNSVTFAHNNNCNFYQWAHQMFLWLTSPDNGKTVMESSLFYTVSPLIDTVRVLIPHYGDSLMHVMPHINQTGPNRLPVMIARNGKRFEIETEPAANAKQLVTNSQGKVVELHHIETAPDGTHRFIDKAGKLIQNPKPIIKNKINPAQVVHEFKVEGKSVFLDADGNEVETEEGQAGRTSGVLMAQNGSLVYYITMINDVYAYFLADSKSSNLHHISGNQFPTDSIALDSICRFARQAGHTLPDSTALTMEIKTSWIEVNGLLPDSESYITIMADIPVIDTSNSSAWVITDDERTAKLALLGIHIVGSMNGHPEMVWATFEHIKNSPNAAYSYLDSAGNVQRMPQDTGTGWLLNNNASDAVVNFMNMKISGDSILAIDSAHTVSASNTLRMDPFGVADSSMTPNQQDQSTAASNSEILSINSAINGLLVGNDVRKNYFLVGATWTFGGAAPDGTSYQSPPDTAHSAIGTSQLANSTMETYHQNQYVKFSRTGSCFFCHSNGPAAPSLAPGHLSHVFSEISVSSFVKK